jgi:hypothetical protein
MENLRCDGDGTWIWEGLCNGSLIIIHDGSFMLDISPQICSAAVMIRCGTLDHTCKCIIAEYLESASSYRGKILGAIITQLILGAAVAGWMGPYPIIIEDCNNNSVILHGNKHYRPLPVLQKQSNVLQVMKHLINCQPFVVKFQYVQSHLDIILEWGECTIKELINIKVDNLAKLALLHTHAPNKFFNGLYPLDDFCIYMDGRKVTGPIKPSLEAHWGKQRLKIFQLQTHSPLMQFQSHLVGGNEQRNGKLPKDVPRICNKTGLRMVRI